ncbi:MAG: hypothetical protein ACP6IU_04400 [Candidatus Asgardarchaeia archaeon]
MKENFAIYLILFDLESRWISAKNKINTYITKSKALASDVVLITNKQLDENVEIRYFLSEKNTNSAHFLQEILVDSQRSYTIIFDSKYFSYFDILVSTFIQTIRDYNAVVLRSNQGKLIPQVAIYDRSSMLHIFDSNLKHADKKIDDLLGTIPNVLVINEFALNNIVKKFSRRKEK